MLNIKKSLLSPDQYFQEEKKKTIIVLHHTAGGPNPLNVIHGWGYNPERVATSYIIAGKPDATNSYKEGDIFQCFEDKYWAYHLGLKTVNNTYLNQISIGIEICNWGQLLLKDGKYLNYINKEVPAEDVIILQEPYRGFKYYHKYSDAQLESVRLLINDICDRYNISKNYNDNMFDVNTTALNGEGGIYSHVSYRTDKNDCSPQPNLIGILKGLIHKTI